MQPLREHLYNCSHRYRPLPTVSRPLSASDDSSCFLHWSEDRSPQANFPSHRIFQTQDRKSSRPLSTPDILSGPPVSWNTPHPQAHILLHPHGRVQKTPSSLPAAATNRLLHRGHRLQYIRPFLPPPSAQVHESLILSAQH